MVEIKINLSDERFAMLQALIGLDGTLTGSDEEKASEAIGKAISNWSWIQNRLGKGVGFFSKTDQSNYRPVLFARLITKKRSLPRIN